MSTITQNANWELLDEIQKVALDYGISRIEQFPYDNRVEITYWGAGQGSILSDLITDRLDKVAPDRDYRIKMIPSDKNLIVELL